MTNSVINAVLIEVNNSGEEGTFYRIGLHAVPRVGEHIDLTSMTEIAAKNPIFFMNYEVVSVTHLLHDIDEKNPDSKGSHEVAIRVKYRGSQLPQ